MIYAQLLRTPEAVDVCEIWNELPKLDVALLRVCRQVHDEAAHFLYSTNTFCFLERCDDFQDDEDDLQENLCRRWLLSIGKSNALSMRHLELRIRDERPAKYYADLTNDIAERAPHLRRLALVVEKHAAVRQCLHDDHYVQRWEPNCIMIISVWALLSLKPSIQKLQSLNLLLLAGHPRETFLNRVCGLFGVRIQAIERHQARRKGDRSGTLWQEKVWYTGVPCGGDQGRRVLRPGEQHEEESPVENSGLPVSDVGREVQNADMQVW
ncbi:hypothetical protein QBC46DRAFT_385406 [Diplogelasinospora grovesii]|uniref:Uncharacterized protein n=1 Tax=Diplogelasinospora grovesii TaxID=303347 RepID=A0AAN6N9Z3_9PEZI|nr:hypothetical protein QBC46DRAFT_385406 [Diplogelasinospora grovesii]